MTRHPETSYLKNQNVHSVHRDGHGDVDVALSLCRLQTLHVAMAARVLDSLAPLQKSLSSEWGEIIMR